MAPLKVCSFAIYRISRSSNYRDMSAQVHERIAHKGQSDLISSVAREIIPCLSWIGGRLGDENVFESQRIFWL